jgi:hypothetical protein
MVLGELRTNHRTNGSSTSAPVTPANLASLVDLLDALFRAKTTATAANSDDGGVYRLMPPVVR